ncbi:MAG: porin [Candidatus Zixiibacteriota bacterium]
MRIIIIGMCLFCMVGGVSGTVGPFEISNADSSTTARLQCVGQFQTVYESKDLGPGKESDESIYMKVRRIRPTIVVSVPEYRTKFKLHLSAAPGAIELMDCYFDVAIRPQFQVRIGQYKIPFTRYRIQSFQRLTFVDWSLVTKYFGAERQMGLTIHNGYEKPSMYGYEFGIFNGVNARGSHAIGLSAVYGEEIINRSDLSESAPKAEFHPELVAHLSYNEEEIDVRSDSDEKRGPLGISVGISAAWDLDPVQYEDLAVRLSEEILFKVNGASCMAAHYLGFVRMGDSHRTQLAFTGILIQCAYRVNSRVEFSLRFTEVDTEKDIRHAAYSRGQAIVNATMDSDIISQYKNAGMILWEKEGTVGFNVYLDGHGLKLQNDFGFTTHDRMDGDRTDYLVRSQLQIAF